MRRIRRVATSIHEQRDHRFLAYCASTPSEDSARILGPAWKPVLRDRDYRDDCLRYMEQRDLSKLSRLQDRDLCIYLPNHNLLYMDKASMAVGLEARVPFLDLAVVEAATRHPDPCKLDGRRTKAVLRAAATGVVPREILERPKAGFGAPFRKWLRYDLAELWEDLTTSSAVRDRGWFDPRSLQEIRRRSQSGQADLYMLQWAVLTVELWARRFLDENPACTAAGRRQPQQYLRSVRPADTSTATRAA
jgi:asparagine synthase (glutamine-hydrolysing)